MQNNTIKRKHPHKTTFTLLDVNKIGVFFRFCILYVFNCTSLLNAYKICFLVHCRYFCYLSKPDS